MHTDLRGYPCVRKNQIVRAIRWGNEHIKVYEEFIKDYKEAGYRFTYESGVWYLGGKYNSRYKIMHDGDMIIVGYNHIHILSEEAFEESYMYVSED